MKTTCYAMDTASLNSHTDIELFLYIAGCDYHSYKENYGNEQFDCRPCPSDYGTRETATTSVDQCICYNGTEPLDECPGMSICNMSLC